MTQPPRGSLFTTAAYISPLGDSACPETGWTAQPAPAGTAPVWLKSHSWGEFVFDQNFARAYQDAGLAYYPKLVCAIPFTPVPGPRLGSDTEHSARSLQVACDDASLSGAHILFLPAQESAALDPATWLQREDIRYVWHNRGYRDFDDFLAALSSKRRKTIRAERRQVATHGFDISWQPASAFSATDWQRLYALYASTYHMRGQAPYLQADCLRDWGRALPQEMLFCVARKDGDIQAMAFFFTDQTHLYGRHWGAAQDWSGLHFELCYYRAIEYCIHHQLQLFDAGVQGSHRLLRGFEPELSESRHYFSDGRFRQAISNYLAQERQMVRQQFASLQQRTAYRQS